jgi:hypothetical protein
MTASVQIGREGTHTGMQIKTALPRVTHSQTPSHAMSVLVTAAALSSFACSGFDDLRELPVEDLGYTHEPTPEPSPDIQQGFGGRWIGEAEHPFFGAFPEAPPVYRFRSGSTSIALDIDIDGSGAASAELVFGAGRVPSPAPGVAFPPGFDAFQAVGQVWEQLPPIEGFAYHLTESQSGMDSLVLQYALNEGYTEWCSIQPAALAQEGQYNCNGTGSWGGGQGFCEKFLEDGTREPVDCDLASLCTSTICTCTAEACSVNPITAVILSLEMHGGELTGTVSGSLFDIGDGARFFPLGPITFRRVND